MDAARHLAPRARKAELRQGNHGATGNLGDSRLCSQAIMHRTVARFCGVEGARHVDQGEIRACGEFRWHRLERRREGGDEADPASIRQGNGALYHRAVGLVDGDAEVCRHCIDGRPESGAGKQDGVGTGLMPRIAAKGQEGLGLGLVIAKDIVEEFGGQLSLKAQDTGACFEIMLVRSL